MNNLLVCVFESNENKPCFNPDKPYLIYPCSSFFLLLIYFSFFFLQDLKDEFLFRSALINTRYVICNITMSLALKLKRMKFFCWRRSLLFQWSDDLMTWFSKTLSFECILHYLDFWITRPFFTFRFIKTDIARCLGYKHMQGFVIYCTCGEPNTGTFNKLLRYIFLHYYCRFFQKAVKIFEL